MEILPLNRELILQNLSDKLSWLKIDSYASVGSTNTVLRAAAVEGAEEGSVAIAAAQTSGRGRYDRSFSSPGGTGVYMSILLRPDFPVEDTPLITTAAAVAVTEAIERINGGSPGIKWVNDIIMNGRKVCGILTESAFSSYDKINYAVLGIGINVFEPEGGFPDELRSKAGSIFPEFIPGIREELAAEVLNAFFDIYPNITSPSVIERYRNYNIVPGRDITVLSAGGAYRARAVDIDDRCRLIVRREDGTEETLSSGEISIKL